MIKIKRGSGLFSCCSCRMDAITSYYHKYHQLPEIDSSEQFAWYKTHPWDLTYLFFKKLNITGYAFPYVADKLESAQFKPYKDLDLDRLSHYIDYYFFPSDYELSVKNYFEQKYSIDYDNTCSIFYRGIEKETETHQAGYDEFIDKAKEIQQQNPNIRFLVQTDEYDFLKAFVNNISGCFCFEEMPVVNRSAYTTAMPFLIKPEDRTNFACMFFAVTLCISQCKYLVTHSGNCGLWAILYRGNSKNVSQFLVDSWIDS